MYIYLAMAFLYLVQDAKGEVPIVFIPWQGTDTDIEHNRFVLMKSNSTMTTLVQHPCNPDISMIISNFLYLSTDAFHTSVQPLQIPFNVLQQSYSAFVTSVAFVKDAVLLVMNGELLKLDLNTMSMAVASGISNHVNHVVTAPCCYMEDTRWCRAHDSIVFAFNSEITNDKPMIWWSKDGGHNFVMVNVTIDEDSQGQSVISGVFPHPLKNEATLLVQINSSTTLMKNFNYLTSQFKDWSEIIPFSTRGEYVPASQLNYRTESFICWNEHTIYYSPVAGSALRPVRFSGQQNNTHINNGEDILMVTPGYSGYFLLLTNQQRVFLGREDGMTAEVTEVSFILIHSY
ncbi:cation channel sperm-associated protein subunit delta-like isoform X1 [Anneissia japonica]|uniref:cation channel sperm-associated protein subunit delta-like isoform X1 n=1 Tax=Anneissia japonica TaxID=1529436 RepID=UPI001425AF7F|nr:cation channel sperm-associated protein subunit delta-like isoform X1 [Anneissia japonica]